MRTIYHKQREIAVEAHMFDEGLRFQPMLYKTRPPTPEELNDDPEHGPVRAALETQGPWLDSHGEARAWATGWLARE
jgi:hypothetical protein